VECRQEHWRSDQPLDEVHQTGHEQQANREKSDRENELETESRVAPDWSGIDGQQAIRPSARQFECRRGSTSATFRLAHRPSISLPPELDEFTTFRDDFNPL
jgi:hypothetical protein